MEIAWHGPAPPELPEMGPVEARAGHGRGSPAGAAKITVCVPGHALEGPEHAPPCWGIPRLFSKQACSAPI